MNCKASLYCPECSNQQRQHNGNWPTQQSQGHLAYQQGTSHNNEILAKLDSLRADLNACHQDIAALIIKLIEKSNQ